MFKFALFGLFISQIAFARNYSCTYGQDQSLTVKQISEKEYSVVIKNKDVTEKYEGVLTKGEEPGSLYKTYEWELVNDMNEPAHLLIWHTPRFGRACGRACQKSLPEMISANLTKDSVKNYYVCSQTNL